MSARLSWSDFPAGEFGTGLVLVRGEKVLRVWLPRPPAAHSKDLKELLSLVGKTGSDQGPHGFAGVVARRLEELFQTGADVSNIAWEPPAASPFRLRVLSACHAIPRGRFLSYRDLAVAAGSPGATRAVGTVMATNPLPLLIPCHRVCRQDGSLGNYGGGEPMKRWLLTREDAL